MNIRITDQGLTNSRQAHVAHRRTTIADAEEAISSGKQVRRPSDAPGTSAQIMRNQDRLKRIEQLRRNTANAKVWLNAADRSLQSVATGLSRARTLGVQAGNATLGTGERDAIASDVRAISEEIRSLANTKAFGRPVFAGTSDAVEAYDVAGTYLGDLASVSRTIDNEETVTVGLAGPTVFGVANPGDPLNGSVFEALEELALATESGDPADLDAAMTAVMTATSRVATAQHRIGVGSRQIDDAELRHGNEEIDVTDSISKLQDTDIAEAMIRLRSAELGYEATMAATARGLSVSLLDFLR